MNKTVLHKGETVNLAIDWAGVEQKLGTTVSSATWASDDNAVALGTATLSASISTVPATNANTASGCATLTNTATMADSQVVVRKIVVDLRDPACSPNYSSDYRRYY